MKTRFKSKETEEAFAKNEIEANRQMCYICAMGGGGLFVALIFYIFKLFPLHNYIQVYITLPILIVLLEIPLFLRKTKLVEKSGFKYVTIYMLLFVIGLLNTLLPKHFVLGYAFLIVLTNHYYSPKFGRIIFFASLATMLVALYIGALIGEYDPNLITSGKVVYDEDLGEFVLYQPESPRERFVFFLELIESGGSNRFIAIAVYYFFARGLLLTMVFLTSNSLNNRTQSLLQREADSQQERTRIATELSVAEEIQRTVLPSATYQSQKVEILAQLKPARVVGGDFYDYWFPDANHLAFLIGDVSGKGIPAAMFMMKTLTSFRASYSLGLKPSEVIQKVNRLIYMGNDASMFVTCFFGVLDMTSGIIEYANGGHNAPLLFKGGKYEYLKCSHGVILGGFEDSFSRDESIQLQKGDGLLLYTDGVTEAKSLTDELYGEQRLLSFVNQCPHETLIEFGRELEDNIAEFTTGAEQSDDITYLLFVYDGDVTYFREAQFSPFIESVESIRNFIIEGAEQAEIQGENRSVFLVAAEEIFCNMVKHGDLPPDSSVLVRCCYKPNKDLVTVTLVDRGEPFDPTAYEDNSSSEYGNNDGAIGWKLAKSLMDEVVYHRTNGKNVVSLSKKIKR
ncbi:MAG: SpoIIE family protein phosphatase [Bacilli bacterium]|nr:SpoIIE family protein phosphatase [Bacilli bacterium]